MEGRIRVAIMLSKMSCFEQKNYKTCKDTGKCDPYARKKKQAFETVFERGSDVRLRRPTKKEFWSLKGLNRFELAGGGKKINKLKKIGSTLKNRFF